MTRGTEPDLVTLPRARVLCGLGEIEVKRLLSSKGVWVLQEFHCENCVYARATIYSYSQYAGI